MKKFSIFLFQFPPLVGVLTNQGMGIRQLGPHYKQSRSLEIEKLSTLNA